MVRGNGRAPSCEALEALKGDYEETQRLSVLRKQKSRKLGFEAEGSAARDMVRLLSRLFL
jgi:hypothetical protein